jgi:hypothetical protein
VILVANQIIQEAGLINRIGCAGGDLRVDSWPSWADLILLSSFVSCYEHEAVQALLTRMQAYLPSGGHLPIDEQETRSFQDRCAGAKKCFCCFLLLSTRMSPTINPGPTIIGSWY